MKKITLPVLIIGTILMFTSCTKSNSPEKTVTSFIEAINQRNWDAAKANSTKESESMLDMVKGFADMVPDSAYTPLKFEIIKEKTVVDGEKATVYSKDENGNEMAYQVLQVDGKWKVNFTMEAIMGDMKTEDILDEAMDSMSETMESTEVETDTMK
ncbi:MAG: DUF4878 domain-containing protein [Bacteroidetes bacterium]|nr:DUF4878 domain-containing protein [Bacteroidota bacterium]MBK8683081.1 DUF4878 domain-containing protein [Bacteroidota bacterium]